MNRKLIAAALAAASFLALPAAARTNVEIVVGFAPPPLYYEPLPLPRVGYVWVPGYWDWRGHRHHWVAGRYVRERPGYTYYEGRWVPRGPRWAYVPPGWHAHGDRDRDGIPDRYDRRPKDPRRG